MRQVLILLLTLLPICLYAQGSAGFSASGTVSLEVTILESKVEKAIMPAQEQAIFQVLFRGVPGTAYESPLLTTDEEGWFRSFPEYFGQLLDKDRGRMSSFIVSTNLLSKGKNADKKKYVSLQICVNVNALLHDLQNHGIKRRFGL